jgi:hypothetical protein
VANAFEDLLDTITDENDRKVLTELGGKYKELKDGVLRQSDYSKQMNLLSEDKKKFDSERAKVEADLAKLEQWNSWRINNWDDDQAMTKAEIKKLEEIQSLTSELEIMKAAQEAGMTFDELDKHLASEPAKKNLVTRDYLDKDFRKDLVDQAQYKKDLDAKIASVANGLDYLYSSTLPAVLKHKDEFGEILRPDEIIKYANDNGIQKIDDAYDRMVAPRRAEIAAKKHADELIKAEEKGRVEERKERGMGQNGLMPVDNGAPVMGHMEKRLRMAKDKTTGEIPEDAKLGTLSNMIAEKYRKEKAEGKTEDVIAQFARTA